MGLKYPLTRDQNHMGVDFPEAYWKLEDIQFAKGLVAGTLKAYPSREASLREGLDLPEERWMEIPIGGPRYNHIYSELWAWNFSYPLQDVFPKGIPLDEDVQKKTIYNHIKATTPIKFQDVLD